MAKKKCGDWLANEIEVLLYLSLSEIFDPLAERNLIGVEELRELKHAAMGLAMSRISTVVERYEIVFNHDWLVEEYDGGE